MAELILPGEYCYEPYPSSCTSPATPEANTSLPVVTPPQVCTAFETTFTAEIPAQSIGKCDPHSKLRLGLRWTVDGNRIGVRQIFANPHRPNRYEYDTQDGFLYENPVNEECELKFAKPDMPVSSNDVSLPGVLISTDQYPGYQIVQIPLDAVVFDLLQKSEAWKKLGKTEQDAATYFFQKANTIVTSSFTVYSDYDEDLTLNEGCHGSDWLFPDDPIATNVKTLSNGAVVFKNHLLLLQVGYSATYYLMPDHHLAAEKIFQSDEHGSFGSDLFYPTVMDDVPTPTADTVSCALDSRKLPLNKALTADNWTLVKKIDDAIKAHNTKLATPVVATAK